MSTTLATTPTLIDYLCPMCLKAGKRNVIIRAAKGAIVEAYCWKCKYRKVVIV